MDLGRVVSPPMGAGRSSNRRRILSIYKDFSSHFYTNPYILQCTFFLKNLTHNLINQSINHVIYGPTAGLYTVSQKTNVTLFYLCDIFVTYYTILPIRGRNMPWGIWNKHVYSGSGHHIAFYMFLLLYLVKTFSLTTTLRTPVWHRGTSALRLSWWLHWLGVEIVIERSLVRLPAGARSSQLIGQLSLPSLRDK